MAGKYAAYVWSAYGASAIAFAWMILDTLIRARSAKREVERLEADSKRAGGE